MKNNLHIGGTEVKTGWLLMNIEPLPGVDLVGDIRDLGRFEDNIFDQIYASHVLEHVELPRMQSTMEGLFRVLKPGGRIMVAVPDLDVLCRMMLHPQATIEMRYDVMRMIFGGQTDHHDYHYYGWTEDILAEHLRMSGFRDVTRVKGFGLFLDTSEQLAFGVPISLNMLAYK